jgi:hypothetical protein
VSDDQAAGGAVPGLPPNVIGVLSVEAEAEVIPGPVTLAMQAEAEQAEGEEG